MRVRYGKPVKVISLLNSFNALGTSDGSAHMVARKEGYFKHDASVNNLRKFSIINGHKYFLCAKTEFALSSFVIMRGDDWYYPLFTSSTPAYTNGNSYSIIDVNVDNNNVGLLIWCNNATIDDWKVYNCIIIDLTEIGLDNLTAQQFYEKYHRYFPLIATGEEITIDDKAGQISISRLPNEYQEVEYIQSDSEGKAYINTYCPIFNYDSWSIKLKIKRGQNYFGGYQSIWNSTKDPDTFESWITTSSSNNLNVRYNGTAYRSLYTIAENTVYNFETSYNGTNIIISVDGNVLINQTQAKTSIDVSSVNLTLGHISDYTTFQYFECVLEGDSEIIRHFIPCYRKSDNVIGMYDLVSHSFFENKGTGTFLKGNNVNNTISCKVAGGSSDIYYGYNQRLNSANGGNRGSNECSYSYNEANNEFTFTASSNTTHTYFGLGCYNLSAMQGHRALCIAKITDISISDTFNDISFSWALSYATITDRHNVTTAGDWVYAIGTWGATTTANYLNISRSSGTYVQGDYFKVKDVQIIDLTDWFGPGKEPSTVQEFKQKFTKEYYGYCPTAIKLTQYQIEALPTYGYNQLFVPTTSTANWISNGTNLTFNSDGSVTMVKYRNNSYNGIQMVSSKASDYYNTHKYFWACDVYVNTIAGNGAGFGLNLYSSGSDYAIQENQQVPEKTWYRDEKIFTPTKNSSGTIYPWIFMNQRNDRSEGDSCTVKNVMFIDLTDWYGSGNEPTTVEEFKQTFLNKYYPYSKKRLLNKYMINKLID